MQIPTTERLGEMFHLTAEEYTILKKIYSKELRKCGIEKEDEMPEYPDPIYNKSRFLSELAFKEGQREEESIDGSLWIGEYNRKYNEVLITELEDILEYNRNAVLYGEDESWVMVYKGDRHWDVSLFLCVFRAIMAEIRSKEKQEETEERETKGV